VLGTASLLVAACTKDPPPPTPPPAADDPGPPVEDALPGVADTAPPADSKAGTFVDPLEGEAHFEGQLQQLTFGGENAEAYLSFDETQLIFQSTRDGMECDQIFTMGRDGSNTQRVSTGEGRTTCAFFLPGDETILYASTHATDPGCLPPPDRSHGYVWKLYSEFDIYTSAADGSGVAPLIAGKGYDAEATVSPAGDKIVFTSTRSGDPEIYVANIDGTGVKRLTKAKGYDGGPFFSPDGTKIVYRANHPKGKEELGKYNAIIKEGLVRPTRLELFVMDADGKHSTQITDNGKANFAPFFHPDGQRIIFASNIDDPQGRNFDLYLVSIDGKTTERVTTNATFDGFPMFTRDGKQLVFASNRNNAAEGDTNVFMAQWKD
jgi:Tol biopolymer transport system component